MPPIMTNFASRSDDTNAAAANEEVVPLPARRQVRDRSYHWLVRHGTGGKLQQWIKSYPAVDNPMEV